MRTDRKKGFIVRKFQRGLSSMETWCERWNVKINEDDTQGIYFSSSRRQPGSSFTLNGRNIPFVNSAKYLCVIFDRKVTWRLLAKHNRFQLIWVPGHEGIVGNKTADQLAKQDLNIPSQDLNQPAASQLELPRRRSGTG
jgi:hypothetical protein